MIRDNRTFTEKLFDLFSNRRTNDLTDGPTSSAQTGGLDTPITTVENKFSFQNWFFEMVTGKRNFLLKEQGDISEVILKEKTPSPVVTTADDYIMTEKPRQTSFFGGLLGILHDNSAMSSILGGAKEDGVEKRNLINETPEQGVVPPSQESAKGVGAEGVAIEGTTSQKESVSEQTKALFLAIEEKDEARLTLLLKEGADPNATNEYGESVMQKAAEGGSLQMVESLIEAGADVNKVASSMEAKSPLLVASERGDSEIVHALLQAGADVSYKDEQGKTALHYASHPDMLKELIENGADLTAEDLNGRAPLHDMVARNQFEVIEEALFYGADPDKADVYGRTALQEAALNGQTEILKVLTENRLMEERLEQNRDLSATLRSFGAVEISTATQEGIDQQGRLAQETNRGY